MKPHLKPMPLSCSDSRLAFSSVDLLIVVATMALLFGLFAPGVTRCGTSATRISCINNQKSIGLAYRSWAIDREGYPTTIPNRLGGTLEYTNASDAYRHFQALSNELASPKILICPADIARKPALDFTNSFGNATLSYFFALDTSEESSGLFLAGDRNVSTNSNILSSTLLTISTNIVLQWTRDLHNGAGNVVLADGSVQQLVSGHLKRYPEFGTNESQRLLFP
jgi:prepilin-type processing-associated H-X9-DG protein